MTKNNVITYLLIGAIVVVGAIGYNRTPSVEADGVEAAVSLNLSESGFFELLDRLNESDEGEVFGAVNRDTTTISNPWTFTQDLVASDTLEVTGATTLTGAVNTTGALTVGTNITSTNGNLTVSSGIASIVGETATSTLVEDIFTFTRTSATDFNTDGIGSGLLFKAFDSDGNATNTARISTVMDDVTSGSDETSIIFEQLLDGGIALSNVFELDSGGAIFNETGASVDFRVEGDSDSNLFFVDGSADRIGIGSSTPTYDLSIGTLNATSTTGGGYFCQHYQDEAGRVVWITLATSGNTAFATSTTACNI